MADVRVDMAVEMQGRRDKQGPGPGPSKGREARKVIYRDSAWGVRYGVGVGMLMEEVDRKAARYEGRWRELDVAIAGMCSTLWGAAVTVGR